MSWKNFSYKKKGVIIGFVMALLLFFFFSDFGRGIRHPITDFFIHSPEKFSDYQECMNKKLEDYHNTYSDKYIKSNPTPVITKSDCFTKTGKFLNNIGREINNYQNRGHFGTVIYFSFFIIVGMLVGLIIDKIKSK